MNNYDKKATEDEEKNLKIAEYIIDKFNLDPSQLLKYIPEDAFLNMNNKINNSIKEEIPFLQKIEDNNNQLKEYEKNKRFKNLNSVVK